jgi:hypothetical protein
MLSACSLGLGNIPEGRPLLLVGNHQTLALDLGEHNRSAPACLPDCPPACLPARLPACPAGCGAQHAALSFFNNLPP